MVSNSTNIASTRHLHSTQKKIDTTKRRPPPYLLIRWFLWDGLRRMHTEPETSPSDCLRFILSMDILLPPEVISNILDAFTSSPTGTTQPTKTELGLCSLTCRHWASKFRPLLFRKITLASHEEALLLLEFIQRPNSQVGNWINHLVLVQSEPSYPWTQLIYLRFSRQIPRSLEITHILKQNSDPTTQAPQLLSIHPSVPKSLPSLYYRCIRAHLVNLRLRSFSNLIPLVGQLNMCTHLRCVDVSWAKPANPATCVALRAGKRRLMQDILMENCSDSWVYTWLCVTTDSCKKGAPEKGISIPFIRGAELRCLSSLICAVHSSRRCKQMRLISEFYYACRDILLLIIYGCCCGPLGKELSADGFGISLVCEETEKCVPDLMVWINVKGMISNVELTYGPNRGWQTIDFPRGSTFSPRYRWAVEVSRALAPCAELRKVRVDIDSDTQLSNVELEDASRSLVDGLANLRNVLEIRYRDISSHPSGWKIYTIDHGTGMSHVLKLGCGDRANRHSHL